MTFSHNYITLSFVFANFILTLTHGYYFLDEIAFR
jgi:hypothetical protein